MLNRALFSLILLLFIACVNNEPKIHNCMPCGLCTTEFRIYSIYLNDRNNNPVDSANITVTAGNNRVIWDSELGINLTKGNYIIFTDNNSNLIEENQELNVWVTINKADTSVSQRYIFAMDSCCCHVNKLFGNDTVFIMNYPRILL